MDIKSRTVKKVLQLYRKEIKENWCLQHVHLDVFLANEVFTTDECDIVEVEKTNLGKITKFLRIIETKGYEGFRVYMKALRENNDTILANFLCNKYEAEHKKEKDRGENPEPEEIPPTSRSLETNIADSSPDHIFTMYAKMTAYLTHINDEIKGMLQEIKQMIQRSSGTQQCCSNQSSARASRNHFGQVTSRDDQFGQTTERNDQSGHATSRDDKFRQIYVREQVGHVTSTDDPIVPIISQLQDFQQTIDAFFRSFKEQGSVHNETEAYREKIQQLETDLVNNTGTLQQLQRNYAEAEQSYKDRIQQLETELKQAEDVAHMKQDKIDELNAINTRLEDELNACRQELEMYKTELNKYKTKHNPTPSLEPIRPHHQKHKLFENEPDGQPKAKNTASTSLPTVKLHVSDEQSDIRSVKRRDIMFPDIFSSQNRSNRHLPWHKYKQLRKN